MRNDFMSRRKAKSEFIHKTEKRKANLSFEKLLLPEIYNLNA